MAEFGNYPRHESRVYTVPVEAHTVPLALHFQLAGEGPRDFAFIPDGNTAQIFPAAFEGFAHSDALRSIFCYLGQGRSEVRLCGPGSLPASRRREVRFALVKWNRSGPIAFPRAVHCIQKVSFGHRGLGMHEIVEARVEPEVTEGAVK